MLLEKYVRELLIKESKSKSRLNPKIKELVKSPLTKAFYKSRGSLTTYLLRNEIKGNKFT